MCGIAGIYGADKDPHQSVDTVKRMLSALRHRGPDGFGMFRDGRVLFGHARLSIIDLSGGWQPMSNEDKTVWITFNGEVFNYLELREELLEKGHRFETGSDTEVIVHLYEDLGEGCLERLNGQFAFAIWDSKKDKLFIARDRLGIRPLFYSSEAGRFYFASEVKALFAAGLRREIDPVALDETFTFWHTLAPRTAFKGVRELMPGHYLTVRQGVEKTVRYWDVGFGEEADISFEDACEELKSLLIDSTRLQLRADVPVGAYLSGGLDSSVTAALVRNFTGSSLKTFSVAFEDSDYDESAYQQEMARALGTEHNEIRCSYSDISGCFPQVVWHAEKPILRTAPAPLYLLSGLVRENNFKVVLTGEGADEVLGGYDIFKETKIRQFWARFPDSVARPLLLKRLYPYLPAFQGQPRKYLEAFFGAGLTDTGDPFFSHRTRWRSVERNKLFFSDGLKSGIGEKSSIDGMLSTLPSGYHGWGPVEKAQYLETRFLLPGYILSSQGDRMAMAHSVEGRFPFLDHRLVEFAARLPARYKLKGLDEKHILKRCMRQFLPEAIVRRSKRPYLAPEAKSFFGHGRVPDYVDEMLSDKAIGSYGYFNPKSVVRLVNKCRSGAALGFKDNMALVGILSTQLLHRMFVEKFECPADYKNIRFHDFKEAGQCASRSENSSRTISYSARTPA